MDGRIHELGGVEYRRGLDAGRQASVDLLELRFGRRRHGAAVAADEHKGSAENHFAAVHAGAAGAQLASECHLRQILDADRRRAAGSDELAPVSLDTTLSTRTEKE